MKYLFCRLGAIALAALQKANADLIVELNTADVSIPVKQPRSFEYDPTAPVAPGGTSQNSGPAVFGGYQEPDGFTGSMWQVQRGPNEGMRLRWDDGGGLVGGTYSGLFLSQKADFAMADAKLTSSARISVTFEADTLADEAAGAFDDATFRFVVDADRYYISEPLAVDSTSLTFNPNDLTYFRYLAFDNHDEVGLIRQQAVPNFAAVEALGFRLDATRGAGRTKGALGVTKFQAFDSTPPAPTPVMPPTPAPVRPDPSVYPVFQYLAADIKTARFRMNSFTFAENQAILTTTPGYNVFGGFADDTNTNTDWVAGNAETNGLSLFWGENAGAPNLGMSGLFLFNIEEADFGANAFVQFSTVITAGETLQNELFRTVIRDPTGYHISTMIPLAPDGHTVTAYLRQLTWKHFNPFENNGDAGTVIGDSTPLFTKVTWVGFRLDANRAPSSGQVPRAVFGAIKFRMWGRFSDDPAAPPTKSPTMAPQPTATTAVFYEAEQFPNVVTILHPFAFSADVPFLEPGTFGYTGQAIYAGYAETVDEGSKLRGSVSTGLGLVFVQGRGSVGAVSSALFLYRRKSFLNGLDDENIDINPLSKFMGTLTGNIGDNALRNEQVRFVVRLDEDDYAISNPLLLKSAQDFRAVVLDMNWYTYYPSQADPAEDYDYDESEDGVVGVITSHYRNPNTFLRIRAVGFYLQVTRNSLAADSQYGLDVFEFEN